MILNGAGCKHKPSPPVTKIEGRTAQVGENGPKGPDSGLSRGVPNEQAVGNPTGTDVPPVIGSNAIDPNSKFAAVLANGNADRNKFASETVYFDTDSSAIKTSEQAKLQTVADYYKGNTTDALRVEGYCDERGTEQYNVALGDRRAQAVRDYLANLGVDVQRIMPVSFGEANPVATGHDEAAWKQNRRGVFVLMTPK